MEFSKLTLDSKNLFIDYYKKHPQYSSYLSFANLYMWRNFSQIEFCTVDDEIIVKGKFDDGKAFYSLPQTDEESLVQVIKEILKVDENPYFASFSKSQKELIEKNFKEQFVYKENRDNFNYYYETEKLITLSGKKLHSKRNHINKFKANYEYTYTPIDDENVKECLAIHRNWCKQKNCHKDETMKAEFTACEEALENLKELNLKGGAIKVNGEIIAFSIGELLNHETALIHIEKANTDFDGAFTIMNNEFVKNEWQTTTYINREEDMGLEGLRKAKLSYYPTFLFETYDISIRNLK